MFSVHSTHTLATDTTSETTYTNAVYIGGLAVTPDMKAAKHYFMVRH